MNKRVESGLQSFMLDVSPWTILQSQADQLKLAAIKIKILTGNNQRCITRERADTLKISKSSSENHLHHLDCAHHFDVKVPHKVKQKEKKKVLTVFPRAILFLNVNKNVPILKQIVTGNEKWILHNNVEQKRSQGKQNEPPLTSPKAGGGVHTAGLEGSPLL